jgi:hypothetical protein
LDVTDLVATQLRIVDSSVASLEGTVIFGQKTGRTEVQVNKCLSKLENNKCSCFSLVVFKPWL